MAQVGGTKAKRKPRADAQRSAAATRHSVTAEITLLLNTLRELAAIRSTAEDAAARILDSAEGLLALADKEEAKKAEDAIMSIMTACGFHDLVGQRVTKITEDAGSGHRHPPHRRRGRRARRAPESRDRARRSWPVPARATIKRGSTRCFPRKTSAYQSSARVAASGRRLVLREQLGEMGRIERLAAFARRMQPARHEHRIDAEIAGTGDVGVDAVADGQNLVLGNLARQQDRRWSRARDRRPARRACPHR